MGITQSSDVILHNRLDEDSYNDFKMKMMKEYPCFEANKLDEKNE
jgi:hypothetical protein